MIFFLLKLLLLSELGESFVSQRPREFCTFFKDRFWFGHLPLVRVMEFQFLAWFPVDFLSHPVIPCLVFLLCPSAEFTYFVINCFFFITMYQVQVFFFSCFPVIFEVCTMWKCWRLSSELLTQVVFLRKDCSAEIKRYRSPVFSRRFLTINPIRRLNGVKSFDWISWTKCRLVHQNVLVYPP